MFWVLVKPQCRPLDLQETDANVCAVFEKETWHFFKSHCLCSWYTTTSWNMHELLSLSRIASVLTVWFLYPSSPVHIIQLKLVCGLWLLSYLIHSQCSCPACYIPRFMRTISLGSIAHTSPSNLLTLCTLLPWSKNSGPEKTNSLLGSWVFCVLRDGLFIVRHWDGLCLKGAWRGGGLFAKLEWMRLVEVYNIQRERKYLNKLQHRMLITRHGYMIHINRLHAKFTHW